MYQIKKRGTRKDDERKRSELTGVIVGIITKFVLESVFYQKEDYQRPLDSSE